MQDSDTWKVIYASSRQEKKVAILLQKMGVEFYLPLIKHLRVWSDRKKWIESPLFNGYLFVRPKNLQRDLILALPGVVKFLRYNGQDASLNNSEVETMRNLIARGYEIADLEGNEQFKVGEKVKIVAGPMKNYEGEILMQAGDRFAFIVLENFGRAVKVKLPKQVIRKIG
jgi:transcription antitermination factor NusG